MARLRPSYATTLVTLLCIPTTLARYVQIGWRGTWKEQAEYYNKHGLKKHEPGLSQQSGQGIYLGLGQHVAAQYGDFLCAVFADDDQYRQIKTVTIPDSELSMKVPFDSEKEADAFEEKLRNFIAHKGHDPDKTIRMSSVDGEEGWENFELQSVIPYPLLDHMNFQVLCDKEGEDGKIIRVRDQFAAWAQQLGDPEMRLLQDDDRSSESGSESGHEEPVVVATGVQLPPRESQIYQDAMNQQTDETCVAAIGALAALSLSRNPGNNPRSLSGFEPISRIKRNEKGFTCSTLNKFVLKKKGLDKCTRIKNLEFSIKLSNDLWAGTYDSIGAILSGPAGEARFTIADQPERGFEKLIPVGAESFSGSDAIDINGISKVHLTADGIFWKWTDEHNDKFEVQSITLRASCVDSDLTVRNDIHLGKDTWFGHSRGTAFTIFKEETVATLDATVPGWRKA